MLLLLSSEVVLIRTATIVKKYSRPLYACVGSLSSHNARRKLHFMVHHHYAVTSIVSALTSG